VYLLGLLWVFMGVALVSDVFMGSIERITSKKVRVFSRDKGRWITVKVWNDTVANLTLMALGSSAPEIMLSLLELIGNDFYSGDLGPSTIVGSAAFNLFVISAVCVMAIPDGELRQIEDLAVFTVTATFSLFAYFWLYLVVSIVSEDVIDIWEAVATLFFFPGLVLVAYTADKGYMSSSRAHAARIIDCEIHKEELAMIEMQILHKHGHQLTDEELTRIIEVEYGPPVTRAAYRVGATRQLFGGKRKSPTKTNNVKPESSSDDVSLCSGDHGTLVEFACPCYTVLECVGTLTLSVIRRGDISRRVWVDYETKDGTAQAHSDFMPVSGRLIFDVGETKQTIGVEIIDDSKPEEIEDFFVELKNPFCEEKGQLIGLGEASEAQIRIIDDDQPGILAFEHEVVKVREDTSDDTILSLVVQRKGGCRGSISCKYWTEDVSAVGGVDYIPVRGELGFEDTQAVASIDVIIKPRGRYENSASFRLILADPCGGARLEHGTDGGRESDICTVIIESDQANKERTDRVLEMLQIKLDRAAIGTANWKEQFLEALWPAGDDGEAGVLDWLGHLVTVFWKVLFAFIPPVDYCNGWVCFVVSLCMIALITACINDLAGLLGCTMGIPDSITAITFVALGTSLPDTFASKTAAVQDPYADASIGNVTGSNSVNVFLGLGMPWVIGSVYWRLKGQDDEWKSKYPDVDWKQGEGMLVVEAGNLAFSVVVFSVGALSAVSILCIRRRTIGGELGGSRLSKVVTSAVLVFLWFAYIALSSWRSMTNKGPCE